MILICRLSKGWNQVPQLREFPCFVPWHFSHQAKESERSTCAGRHLTAAETAITNSTNASQREPFMAIVCGAPTNACANVSTRDHLMSCLTRSLLLSQPEQGLRLQLNRALLVRRNRSHEKSFFFCQLPTCCLLTLSHKTSLCFPRLILIEAM